MWIHDDSGHFVADNGTSKKVGDPSRLPSISDLETDILNGHTKTLQNPANVATKANCNPTLCETPSRPQKVCPLACGCLSAQWFCCYSQSLYTFHHLSKYMQLPASLPCLLYQFCWKVSGGKMCLRHLHIPIFSGPPFCSCPGVMSMQPRQSTKERCNFKLPGREGYFHPQLQAIWIWEASASLPHLGIQAF